MPNQEFIRYLENTSKKVSDYILNCDVVDYLKPEHIKESVLAYLRRPSKRLRPAILLLSCGSVGGDEEQALCAAAGVELFHTWTLVHDDVIDNDDLRRGQATVHRLMTQRGKTDMNLSESKAIEYGRDIAILAGDVQHGWSTAMFFDCALKHNVAANVVLTIVRHLQTYILNMLLYGEVLDVQLSLQNRDIASITEDDVIQMLWLKTGVLYEFSSIAGAMIGKNTDDLNDVQIKGLKEFTGNCGIAFQLQDDILGVIGDEKLLGKPVGSDIREGKKTTILLHALQNASSAQRQKLLTTIGNQKATTDDFEEVKQLLIELGGIRYTSHLAETYIHKALPNLDLLPDSRYKMLLKEWAEFMIDRRF
ncbi:polyprenyl synthetase family protein [candidate division KSB1 bacterium]|nr:polyprenyl synthetase family protein [candidate division KSB1 bacterium]